MAPEDHQRIQETLDTYLSWVRTGHPELWKHVFHPHATVVNASRGDEQVAVWSIDEFVRRVEVLRSKIRVVEETARSVRIDLARHVAAARVDFELRLGAETYTGTDFFSLARVGNRWLITHKHYDGDRPL
jgi:hypothetical protein